MYVLLLQLVAVLREVKYLEIRGSEEIPGSAATIYSKNDTFRQYVANLDLTVQWYNKVRTTVLEVMFMIAWVSSCMIISVYIKVIGWFARKI